MNAVQRTKGVRKVIRQFAFRKPVPKYVVAGDRACRRMVREARSRRQPGPSDRAILAWAGYDLAREIASGFWEYQPA